MQIEFQRISPTHHRFHVRRADGTTEMRELETRSTLWHDLVHYALESEAGLTDGFYGLLASGRSYASLTTGDPMAAGAGIAAIERVVGPLQTAVRGAFDAVAFVATLSGYLRQIGEPRPPWLTAELLTRVAERLRRLDGQWRGTKFGEAMLLQFGDRH